jgi:hypothetical protein
MRGEMNMRAPLGMSGALRTFFLTGIPRSGEEDPSETPPTKYSLRLQGTSSLAFLPAEDLT